MALILNLETTSDVCSVSIGENGTAIDSVEDQGARSHATLLAPFIEKLLTKNAIKPQELSAVAVSKGPGSYTGLRIGTSTAKGICYAIKKPLIGISTLLLLSYEALEKAAEKIPDESILCPMIDARRMEVYHALFDITLAEIKKPEPLIITGNSFLELLQKKPVVFFGNGAEKARQVIQHANAIFIEGIYPTAKYMVALSEKALLNNNVEDTAYFQPFYLKEFQATTPKKKIL